jgi:hypothetical protein
MKSNQIFSLVALLFFSLCTYAQDNFRQTSHQSHSWLMFFGNHRLTDKWSLHTEYQWRRAEGIKDWQQSLARIGIDYRVKDNVIVSGGYGHIVTYPYGDFPVAATFIEHRAWEQLMLSHHSGRVIFQHRYRLEQRWLENMIKTPTQSYTRDGFLYSNRFRYKFTLTIPLNKAKISQGSVFTVLYDEPFLSFGKNIKYNIFDQNRLYAAVGYQLNSHANIQAGYLNQIILKPAGNKQEMNHTLQAALTWNLDLRKKNS